MLLNRNRFIEMTDKHFYHIKWKHQLQNVDSHIIHKCNDILKDEDFNFNHFIQVFRQKLEEDGNYTQDSIEEFLNLIEEDFNNSPNYYFDSYFYGKYPAFKYLKIDSYNEFKNHNQLLECPNCHMKPLKWIFDNGASTVCGCGKNQFNNFSIHAESIMSKYKRTGSTGGKTSEEELLENWNHWVETGEDNFAKLKAELKEQGIDIW